MAIPAPTMPLTAERVVSDEEVQEQLYSRLYVPTFADLEREAAYRHMLTREEFVALLTDDRVVKHIAWSGDEPVGLTTLTNDLTSVPWISAGFYRHRYPQYAQRNAIWYYGLAMTRDDFRLSSAMPSMTAAMATVVSREGGVCGYDICDYNNRTFRFQESITRMFRKWCDVQVESVDSQTFYAMIFPKAEPAEG